MNASLPIASALLGCIILLFGRKLFWLCIAAFGFAAGVELAPHVLVQPTPLLQLSFALVLGFVGALLALLLQKIAVGLVGLGAGARLGIFFAGTSTAYSNYWWIFAIVGGILGAILFLALFDWALIFLSAILGAYLLMSAIVLPKTIAPFVFAGLALVGIFAQAAILRGRRVAAD